MADFSQKPFNPQDLYPQEKAVTGMAAKTPTVFSIPLFKTTLLLFLPVYLITAMATLYMYDSEKGQAALAINSIALFMGILLVILVGIVMLAAARSIIVRNCSHPVIIEFLYVIFIAPMGYFLTQYSPVWFRGVPLHLIAIQAIILFSMTFILTLIARASSRS